MKPTRSPNLPSGAQRIVAQSRARTRPGTVRRLAILAEDGTLARTGRWSELLMVIERHGDRALTFVWRNNGALAVATVLGTFLADPEALLDGGRELVGKVAREATQPLPDVADAAASRWMNIALSVVAIGLAWLVLVLAVLLRLIRHIQSRSRH
jgi:hypothetical protein